MGNQQGGLASLASHILIINRKNEIKKVLERNGLNVAEIKENILAVPYSGYKMLIIFSDMLVTVVVMSDVRGSTKNVSELLHYCSLVNYSLISGCFTVDVDDGEVRYETSTVIIENMNFSDHIVELMNISLRVFKKYIPPVPKIHIGYMSAEKAYAEVS